MNRILPSAPLVSRDQTAIFSFCVGAGKNRAWYISHTKVVLSHLEVLTLYNLFLAIRATLLVIKRLLFVLYRDGEEIFFLLL